MATLAIYTVSAPAFPQQQATSTANHREEPPPRHPKDMRVAGPRQVGERIHTINPTVMSSQLSESCDTS